MRRHFRLLNQNCRLAARLMSDQQDYPLSWIERIGLSTHLALCGRCRRYRQQLRAITAFFKPNLLADNPTTLPLQARLRIYERLIETAKKSSPME